MHISVLGVIAVTGREGGDATPTAAKDLAFLGELLAHAGSFVSSDHLVDRVWGRRPTADPLNAVQVRVSRLRRLFRKEWGVDGEAVVVTKPGGYVLDLDRYAVDARDFEDLVRQSRCRREHGDPSGAAGVLARGLAMWRGAPFSGLQDSPCTAAEAARLEEVRATAAETYAELVLGLGRPQDAVGTLGVLTSRYPLREHAHRLLMEALHACGRPAEALLVYERLRGRLAEQLGVAPGQQVQARYQALLSGRDEALDRTAARLGVPAPARTRGRVAAGRDGVRPRSQAHPPAPPHVRAPDRVPARATTAATATTAAMAATGHGAVSGIPRLPACFTGRTEAVGLVERVLDGPAGNAARAVAVSGMPGAGKSALAAVVAHRMGERFPDGRIHLDLRGGGAAPPPAARVLRQALTLLGGERGPVGPLEPEPAPGSDAGAQELSRLTARLRRAVTGRRVLFVFDDVAGAAQLRPLLEPLAGCAVLATSRSPLAGLDGFTLVRVGPLPPTDSVELLSRLAGAGRVAAEAAEAGRVADLCGHLPLALRVVGARLAAHPALSLADLAGALARGASRLDELEFDDLSVRRSLASGHRALARASDTRGRLAARLLPLLGGKRLAEVTPALAGRLLELGPEAGASALEGLAAAGFVTAGRDGCHAVHALVQDYAREVAEGGAGHRRAPEPARPGPARRPGSGPRTCSSR
ncbi:AfsR/SARP family transcriptional regulator [Streptomyces nojiriensis]|uniref:AfsR/SARP family transcriptional regulator n=1 Tax=Streptomyces nojiriensis TaxID=66374 RepID=UPI0035DD0527